VSSVPAMMSSPCQRGGASAGLPEIFQIGTMKRLMRISTRAVWHPQ